jgi:hypothetical protein
MNSQLLHVMDLRSTLANIKYLFLYLTSTTSDMLQPPPPVRGRHSETIPVKRVFRVFDTSGSSPAASSMSRSLSGNGNAMSFRMGFGKMFGNVTQSSEIGGTGDTTSSTS